MATILDFGKLTVDAPSKVGDLGMKPGSTEAPFPYLPGGVSVWSYSVPVGGAFRAKSLAITITKTPMSTQVPGTVINAGTAKIRLAGSDKAEWRLHAFPPLAGTPGSDELCQAYNNQNNLFSFRGMTVASGDLTITVTPAAANTGLVYFATVWSKTAGGVVQISKGSLAANSTTADQVILTHSPGSDTNIVAIRVEAVTNGANVLHGGYLTLNGNVIMEFGDMGNDETEPCFMGDDYPTQGTFSIPLMGLILNQNDRLELFVHPTCDDGSAITVQLSGTTLAYGGGGSGVSRSRSFVGV